MGAGNYSDDILSGNIIRNHFNFRITFANRALNGINWIKTDIIRNLGWIGHSAQLYVRLRGERPSHFVLGFVATLIASIGLKMASGWSPILTIASFRSNAKLHFVALFNV